MKTLPAGTASALGIVEPMAGTVYGMIFFGEEMTWLSALGIVLILGSVAALGLVKDTGHHKTKKEEKEHEKVNQLS